MFRPGFPRLSHPGLAHATPSTGFIAKVYRGAGKLTDQQRAAQAPNVRRTGITEPAYPFESQLITDIIDDYLAYLLVHCPTDPKTAERTWASKHTGVRLSPQFESGQFSFDVSPMFCTRTGIGLLSPRFLGQVGANVFYLALRTQAEFFTADVCGRDGALVHTTRISTSRLLKNTRIGLFSWPSCVSRPPDNGAHGDTLSRRGGQRHPRPAIRDTSPPDSATGPSYRRWRRR